jgi:hypothetical protein
MKKRAFGAGAVVLGSALALTLSSPAKAQEWLRDPRVGEGEGFHAGEFDVHAGLAAEIGYDSNYLGRSDKTGPSDPAAPLYLANGAPGSPPIATGELRITPSISIRTSPGLMRPSAGGVGGAPVAFSLAASGTYREFFAPELQNQRNMSASATAGVVILPGHEWSGSVSGNYARSIQPTVFGDPDTSYNNDAITGTADLAVQPNVGTLDWHFGYQITAIIFEQSAGQPYNNILQTGYTRGKWRFRPRTALIYDGAISSRTFSDTSDAAFTLHSATPVRARIGLEGLVTPVFSILGMIGYGATLTNPNSSLDQTTQQYDSIIGNLELRFFPSGPPVASPDAKPSLLVSTIALGYMRDFQASYLDDFYGIDRGYLKAEYFFAGRFLITLSGGVAALEHPNLYFGGANGGTTTGILMAKAYTDVAADATLFAEYRILSSLAINATGTYGQTFSNTQLPVSTISNQVYDMNVQRFTAFFGVRWFM